MGSARNVRCAAAGFAVFLAVQPATEAAAQSVGDLAAKGQCSTAGLEGLSAQLVELHLCMFPDQVVEADHPNISATSNRVHLLFTTPTRDALHAAANQTPLQVNSAFRSLADQYVLYHSGACGAAAKPGSSNHQSGLAVDLANWSSVVGIMQGAGCAHPLPGSDPVHFDCPGPDMRSASVLVFQRLWNANNPHDPIAEDGSYGPATGARMAKTPAGGFADNGCGTVGQSMTTTPWAAGVASASVTLGDTFKMEPGETRTVTVTITNSGTQTWDNTVALVTSEPRLRPSAFHTDAWESPDTAGRVLVPTAPGASYTFTVELRAPAEPGHYDEYLTLRQGADVWFADAGGASDTAVHLAIDVGGDFQKTDRPDVHDVAGGCSVGRGLSGAQHAGSTVLLLVIAQLCARGTRRRRSSRT